MKAQKQPDAATAPSATAPSTSAQAGGRKPWKKKTPVDVVLAQIDRLRDDVAEKEEELKLAKRQLQKLEEARKVLEAT
jgi:hypothetical protein